MNETNGTIVAEVPVEIPLAQEVPQAPVEVPPVEVKPPVQPTAPTVPVYHNGNGGRIVRIFSFPVSKDTSVQALISERLIMMRDGKSFLGHEVIVRKLWRTQTGEEKFLYTYRCSELYALEHAIKRAEAWILNQRAEEDLPF